MVACHEFVRTAGSFTVSRAELFIAARHGAISPLQGGVSSAGGVRIKKRFVGLGRRSSLLTAEAAANAEALKAAGLTVVHEEAHTIVASQPTGTREKQAAYYSGA